MALAGLALAAQSYAQQGASPTISSKLSQQQTEVKDKEGQRPGKATLATKSFYTPEEIRALAQLAKTERLDSILGYIGNGTQKYTLQHFIFDDKGQPLKRLNSYWNAATNTWDEPAETYEYVLDDDGYVLEQIHYTPTEGQKYVYEYNDKKWGTSMTSWTFDGREWSPVQRGDYVYDDNANITEETISAWDKAAGQWVKAVKNVATYYADNTRKSLEPYVWDEATQAWVGNGEKKEYVWDETTGAQKRVDSYIWQAGEGWVHYCRFEQDFNDAGLLTRSEKTFLNRELGQWVGCAEWDGSTYYNTKSLLEYDDQNRQKYECAFDHKTTDGYRKASEIYYEWADNEDGSSACTATSWLLPDGGEAYVNDKTETRYNAAGNETYMYSQHLRNNVLADYQKSTNEYDDDQNLVDYKMWTSRNGKWLAGQRITYSYDGNGMVTEQLSQRGQNTGEDDWVNYNRFDYAYEQDTVLVERLQYKWDGSQFAANWGDGWFYDFATPIDGVELWPGGGFYHKMTEQRSYTANAAGGWDYTSFVYHYSKLGSSGIEGVSGSDDGAKTVASEQWHDLQGRAVEKPTSGIFLRTVTYEDGTKATTKVILN